MRWDAELWVGGIPVPQGSKFARVLKNGRAIVVDDNDHALRAWRALIADQAGLLWGAQTPLTGALRVHLQFALVRPKTVKRELPHVKPDLDKLTRAALDALTGLIYFDDAQVCLLQASKVYRPEGSGVRIAVAAMREP